MKLIDTAAGQVSAYADAHYATIVKQEDLADVEYKLISGFVAEQPERSFQHFRVRLRADGKLMSAANCHAPSSGKRKLTHASRLTYFMWRGPLSPGAATSTLASFSSRHCCWMLIHDTNGRLMPLPVLNSLGYGWSSLTPHYPDWRLRTDVRPPCSSGEFRGWKCYQGVSDVIAKFFAERPMLARPPVPPHQHAATSSSSAAQLVQLASRQPPPPRAHHTQAPLHTQGGFAFQSSQDEATKCLPWWQAAEKGCTRKAHGRQSE